MAGVFWSLMYYRTFVQKAVSGFRNSFANYGFCVQRLLTKVPFVEFLLSLSYLSALKPSSKIRWLQTPFLFLLGYVSSSPSFTSSSLPSPSSFSSCSSLPESFSVWPTHRIRPSLSMLILQERNKKRKKKRRQLVKAKKDCWWRKKRLPTNGLLRIAEVLKRQEWQKISRSRK